MAIQPSSAVELVFALGRERVSCVFSPRLGLVLRARLLHSGRACSQVTFVADLMAATHTSDEQYEAEEVWALTGRTAQAASRPRRRLDMVGGCSRRTRFDESGPRREARKDERARCNCSVVVVKRRGGPIVISGDASRLAQPADARAIAGILGREEISLVAASDAVSAQAGSARVPARSPARSLFDERPVALAGVISAGPAAASGSTSDQPPRQHGRMRSSLLEADIRESYFPTSRSIECKNRGEAAALGELKGERAGVSHASS